MKLYYILRVYVKVLDIFQTVNIFMDTLFYIAKKYQYL